MLLGRLILECSLLPLVAGYLHIVDEAQSVIDVLRRSCQWCRLRTQGDGDFEFTSVPDRITTNSGDQTKKKCS